MDDDMICKTCHHWDEVVTKDQMGYFQYENTRVGDHGLWDRCLQAVEIGNEGMEGCKRVRQWEGMGRMGRVEVGWDT